MGSEVPPGLQLLSEGRTLSGSRTGGVVTDGVGAMDTGCEMFFFFGFLGDYMGVYRGFIGL